MIASLMFVCSTLVRAIRKTGRGVSLVANSYTEAAELRRRVEERQRILQLVAEAERSARLVERGSAPDPAGQRLVEQPVIHHEVERAVGRLHLQVAVQFLPLLRDGMQLAIECRRAIPFDELSGLSAISSFLVGAR